ncbi:MAG TPA: arylsulfatase [Pirellulales bacterium]|jgi:arylsulfatase A-like enzyme|nr:arylsulfatase [Pirellulales bacterium]
MNRKRHRVAWPSLALAALLLASLVPAISNAAPAERPNVIVVLSDDQGYGDFSCHGNPLLKTPYLDKLYGQSVRLTDFHVAPMCTPTRGELMTGLDALHSGASSVSAGRSLIRRGIPTMAEIFAAGGYRTAHFGKWHLGDSYPNLPNQRGFQETVWLTGFGVTSLADSWLDDCFDGHYRHNGELRQYPGYCTDVWFDLAMDWMRKQHDAHEPFFIYLPTNAPHGPHWVADKYKEPYRGKGPAGFFGMIANLDENMGRLEAMLDETGLRDNTIVIFFNDNGGTAGVTLFNAGMRGSKTQYYDGGHRAACFISWPAGGLQAPRDIPTLTEVQDLLPTLIDLCGLQAPKDARFDGTSLAGLLKGTTETLPDRKLVVQYGQTPAKGTAAVLWNKWRLVHDKELYDVASDPGQAKDVAAEHPDVVEQMRDHYNAWWAGVEPNLQDFSPLSIGAKQENPVRLSAVDWANVYCDNVFQVRTGANNSGAWHILVEQEGTYEVALRRWPVEADAAICAPVPEFKAVDGTLPAGVALPVVKARLKIGDLFDATKPVGPDDKEVTFVVPLAAGLKVPLQTWFLDADGKQLCGAYYAYVKRMPAAR